MSINMSHCRFSNTLAALRECSEALSHGEGPDPVKDIGLSEAEEKAARELIRLCEMLAAGYGEW